MDKKTSSLHASLKVIKVASAQVYDYASAITFELDHDNKFNRTVVKDLRDCIDKLEFHISSLEKL